MRLVIQRVNTASVYVKDKKIAEIGKGLVIFIAIAPGDENRSIEAMANKIPAMRIFEDVAGRMNLSAQTTQAELLVVSEFTLLADCRTGNRPSFIGAAPPEFAHAVYNLFVGKLRESGLAVKEGIFGTAMVVTIVNDGPVTFVLDN